MVSGRGTTLLAGFGVNSSNAGSNNLSLERGNEKRGIGERRETEEREKGMRVSGISEQKSDDGDKGTSLTWRVL